MAIMKLMARKSERCFFLIKLSVDADANYFIRLCDVLETSKNVFQDAEVLIISFCVDL